MTNRLARLTLLVSGLLIGACGVQTDATTSRLTIDQRCAVDADCPSGFECEVEVEHGTTTSTCKADEATTDCPAGYEVEVEHGQTFCKPHGGGGGGGGNGGGADDSTDDAGDDHGGGAGGGGGAAQGAACTTSADCATGLECEVEVEHGQTTSTCQPHRGGGQR